MAKGEERSILTKGDNIFMGRRAKTFIAPLMKETPNKHTHLSLRGEFGLVRDKAMNIGCTPKHLKGNFRSEVGKGIWLLETI